MTALYPTKTRLALLQAVADGQITEHYPLNLSVRRGLQPPYSVLAELDRTTRRVTAVIAELARAGWVRLDDNPERRTRYGPVRWLLTEAGQAVLDASKARR